MNTNTLDKMRRVRLLGMHWAFETSLETKSETTATADELVAMLIESEWDDRYTRNIERVMPNARFRYKATIEQLDYNAERSIDKTKYTVWQMVSLQEKRRPVYYRQHRYRQKLPCIGLRTPVLPVRL